MIIMIFNKMWHFLVFYSWGGTCMGSACAAWRMYSVARLGHYTHMAWHTSGMALIGRGTYKARHTAGRCHSHESSFILRVI